MGKPLTVGPVRPGRSSDGSHHAREHGNQRLPMPQVMNGEDIGRAIRRITHEILERHRGADDVVVVGIHTRGALLAQELGKTIEKFEGVSVPVGKLDVGEYRDDIDIRGAREQRESDLPMTLEGRSIVLVDDVLYTGRTVRAAMDALADRGRAERGLATDPRQDDRARHRLRGRDRLPRADRGPAGPP